MPAPFLPESSIWIAISSRNPPPSIETASNSIFRSGMAPISNTLGRLVDRMPAKQATISHMAPLPLNLR